jgi:hypothetical protein
MRMQVPDYKQVRLRADLSEWTIVPYLLIQINRSFQSINPRLKWNGPTMTQVPTLRVT